MGILRAAVEKVRKMFGQTPMIDPQLPQISDGSQQYERNERVDRSDDRLDAVRYAYEQGDFKKSSGKDVELLKHVTVGFDPIRSNPRLQHRKNKSQQKNWRKWKKRLKK